MTVSIAKQVGLVTAYRASTQIAKQVAYAQLVYPKVDVAKQVAYAALARPSAQVGKMVAYALLRELPPEIEAAPGAFAFTGAGHLQLGYVVDPELQIFVTLAFAAPGFLNLAGELVPPFLCTPPVSGAWTRAEGPSSGWGCSAPPAPAAWSCTADAGAPSSSDWLADVLGDDLVFLSGDRIKLI